MRMLRSGVLWSFLIGFAGVIAAQPASLVSSAAAPSEPKAADFGPSNLTHVRVSPLEFQPFEPNIVGPKLAGPGLTFYSAQMQSTWEGVVHLPGGSLLKRVELDYCDTSAVRHVHMVLIECDNEWQNCESIPETELLSGEVGGCAFTATSSVAYRIDNYSKSYALEVIIGADDGSNTLGGAILSYQLDVSPAPAAATFADVPTSDPAFQYIEALVASGITAGCGSGNYCPDAPLTRRQMAVFLSKALGLNWAGF